MRESLESLKFMWVSHVTKEPLCKEKKMPVDLQPPNEADMPSQCSRNENERKGCKKACFHFRLERQNERESRSNHSLYMRCKAIFYLSGSHE